MTLPLLLAALLPSADFEKHVRPVLAEHCFACHGEKKQMASLRLDSRAAMLKGGDSGPAVVPGKSAQSLLVRAIRHEGDLKMPARKKLPDDVITHIAAWIDAGAVWPDAAPVRDPDAWKSHWAFRPVVRPKIPDVADPAWAKNPIDRFVRARLGAAKLTPSPRASKETLARRLSLTLTGVPLPDDELSAHLADGRPDAYERLVERLLSSPRLGEKWARHWLDVSRFADTKGYVFFEDAAFPFAWTYRDYVIDAFNADLPYDRFVREQLAADRLPLGADKTPLRALGFLTIGGRFMNNVHDILDDRIDVVTRGLMSLTVTCARCHDHKFDPVPAADYYALYGVFASSVEPPVPVEYRPAPNTPEYAAHVAELKKREKALDDFLAKKFADLRQSSRDRVAEYLVAVHARRGKPRADDFMLLADPGDINPAMITRWQGYLESKARRDDPVWAAWHAFAELPPATFAETARVLAPKIASGRFAKTVHPLVAARFAGVAPTSMKQVADIYSRLLRDVEAKKLDDADLRAVFHGPDAPPDVNPALMSELELLPDRAAQGELQKFRKAAEQWRASGKGAPPRAHVLADAKSPTDGVVFRRGNPAMPGDRVPRRFVSMLSKGERFTDGSGRLELAEAIASPKNPLTARVMVNRVWMHHFGRGLVETAGDFGVRASPPSHPELLDWLAAEFVKSGWSIKRLHRLIVTSETFRQSSADVATMRAVDAENRLLWRFPPRPLSLESLRDSMLHAAGRLDAAVGGPSADDVMNADSTRRTLYAKIDRLKVPTLFRAFDFPSADASSPGRESTLVPQQALFVMNAAFVRRQAERLAERTAAEKDASRRVATLYRLALGRGATAAEGEAVRAFVADGGAWADVAHAVLMGNEFAAGE